MGNPLSGTLATFVLNDFLHEFFKDTATPTLIHKYVDDMFLIMKHSEIDEMMTKINSRHPTLKFTIEREQQHKIAFLDVTVIRENNILHTNWYRKSIASGRVLNYLSSHPYNMKRSVATSFAKRVIRLSNKRYHNENYEIIQDTLHKNNYPTSMINRIINNIKYSKPTSPQIESLPTQNVTYRRLPYVPVLTDKLTKSLKILDDNTIYGLQPTNKLVNLFTKTKSKVKQTKKGFCYKIKCNGSEGSTCDKCYIGETGREDGSSEKLPPRIKEHISSYKSAIREREKILTDRQFEYNRLKTRSKQQQLQQLKTEHQLIDEDKRYNNAAIDHALKSGHIFDYKDFEIIHYSDHYRKRKALESMYIHQHHGHTINFKVDTQYMFSDTKRVIDTHKQLFLSHPNTGSVT